MKISLPNNKSLFVIWIIKYVEINIPNVCAPIIIIIEEGNYRKLFASSHIEKVVSKILYVKLSILNGVLQTGTQLRVEKHDCFTCKCSRKPKKETWTKPSIKFPSFIFKISRKID